LVVHVDVHPRTSTVPVPLPGRKPRMLAQALEHARKHFGRLEAAQPPGRWLTVVLAVLDRLDPATGGERLAVELTDVGLGHPRDVIELGTDAVAELLQAQRLPVRAAGPLCRLADWWLKAVGDADEAPDWPADTERLRRQWLKLPGVSLQLADRLLLFVADRAVLPLSRSVVRVCCRHGWADEQTEYEEWQSLAVRELEAQTDWLRELWLALSRLGKSHCGKTPKCDDCPLRPLLPPAGPVEPA